MAVKLAREREPGPGALRKPGLYALIIDQVIDTGVITLAAPAIKMTGYSTQLTYFVAITMGLPMILPTILVPSTVRLGGGNYSMPTGLAGPDILGIYAFMYLMQCLPLSLFGFSAAAYLGDIIPAFGSHDARIVIGAVLLTFFYVINPMGVDVTASAQRLMTRLLIVASLLFMIFGLVKIKLPIFDFSDPEFLARGWGINFSDDQIFDGFVETILLFVYSTQGYYMTAAYGDSPKDVKRNIPFVLLMCAPMFCVFYVGIAMAGMGSITLAEYGEFTILVVATQNPFFTVPFYFFIIGGPTVMLLLTLNSSFVYDSITTGIACDSDWLPKTFGRKNAKGGRVWILTYMCITGMIPIFFGLFITTITSMVRLIGACHAFLDFRAHISLPKLYPDVQARSKHHVPSGLHCFLCYVLLADFYVTLWKSCLSMSPTLMDINITVIVVLTILGFVRGKRGSVETHISI